MILNICGRERVCVHVRRSVCVRSCACTIDANIVRSFWILCVGVGYGVFTC